MYEVVRLQTTYGSFILVREVYALLTTLCLLCLQPLTQKQEVKPLLTFCYAFAFSRA